MELQVFKEIQDQQEHKVIPGRLVLQEQMDQPERKVHKVLQAQQELPESAQLVLLVPEVEPPDRPVLQVR